MESLYIINILVNSTVNESGVVPSQPGTASGGGVSQGTHRGGKLLTILFSVQTEVKKSCMYNQFWSSNCLCQLGLYTCIV